MDTRVDQMCGSVENSQVNCWDMRSVGESLARVCDMLHTEESHMDCLAKRNDKWINMVDMLVLVSVLAFFSFLLE